MINKIALFWFSIIRSVLNGSKRAGNEDWARKAASLTNLGFGMILSGVVMKVGLRVFGLNNVWFLVHTAMICLPMMYLLSENRIGLSVQKVNEIQSTKRDSSLAINRYMALIIALAYLPSCFVLMILTMKLL